MITSPDDFLAKLDWEGDDGIEWFDPSEFEDAELAQAVEEAKHFHVEFEGALNRAIKRAEELVGEDGQT